MSEKRLVNLGEGRIVEMTELGEVTTPPAPTKKPRHKKPGSRKDKRQKAQEHYYIKEPGKHKGKHPGTALKVALVPGYREWNLLRRKQDSEFMTPNRSRAGVPDGMRKEEAMKLWAEARKKAQVHMANLKKLGLLSDDEIVVKATNATLEILESPLNQDMRLKAARQLLEWFKAKPVSKSEVTVNAAEAWLASIAEDANKAEE